jgi:hypothetical protein
MSKERLQEIKEHVSKFLYLPQDIEWLISEVESLQKQSSYKSEVIHRQFSSMVDSQKKIYKLEKVKKQAINFKKLERLEKALKGIMDLGETYAATTDEHHSCAEGMYRYAEQALETEETA